MRKPLISCGVPGEGEEDDRVVEDGEVDRVGVDQPVHDPHLVVGEIPAALVMPSGPTDDEARSSASSPWSGENSALISRSASRHLARHAWTSP